ncbi:MAG: PH domain-containing protein [Candidatus Burarchaeum sp.]|nr:PH domain-containing protein [Candidatus Burarchaeum sp.]MDO8339961.1 PH domain-containing protein [Candidatus Burarchaeum sp.]
MAESKNVPEAVEKHLDSRIKIAWLLPTFAIAAIIFLLGMAAFIALPAGEPSAIIPSMTNGLVIMAAVIFLELIIVVPSLLLMELRYRAFTYAFEPDGLVIRNGIITREKIVLPYERIQEIKVGRSLAERMLSLSTLCVDTASQAGTDKTGCSVVLPGITYTNRRTLVEDIIMSRIMHRKAGAGLEGLVIPHDYETESFMLQELHRIHELLEKKSVSKATKEEAQKKMASIERILERRRKEEEPAPENDEKGTETASYPETQTGQDTEELQFRTKHPLENDDDAPSGSAGRRPRRRSPSGTAGHRSSRPK